MGVAGEGLDFGVVNEAADFGCRCNRPIWAVVTFSTLPGGVQYSGSPWGYFSGGRSTCVGLGPGASLGTSRT